MMRVAVAGVHGKMGAFAASSVKAADDLEFVGGFARSGDASASVYADFEQLLHDGQPDVVIDFTTHPKTIGIAAECITHGVSPVIGTSAWTHDETDELARLAKEYDVGALLVPNFAIGAVLMMRFAEQAAKFFPSAEVIEMHRQEKLDKPSGTARMTTERVSAVSGNDVPIHSVRMHGLVAHQAVLFSNDGELLTIRHDSFSRESFAAGILLAVRAVRLQHGLTIGLDSLVDARLA
ncbi:MAG: 4-hydroxy-tetrahydrodipicolinate reductase [Candidatus Eremiobacteraeota bacterium]|nr:4-hydroxy-tetrahydrodipicolinate reductase [Candidatus Eremiobacteraeota bacterium]